ncbi:hypothetical protein GCM10022243_04330 [Saccharothrix violaceirubra]|uniref:Uncharacterized protein (DUF1778 family) n=1 Tax=Saccharothrix violaceirubra TaxID=413306 RepID=A0A7W7SXL8_9PSEU|nr:DUF1778 domain-containing protein [Saccharothrix violaceirubra]MBB4962842.1 uncharacterized protein (DUF1778 family) [Saccharothrix violaceirubra]
MSTKEARLDFRLDQDQKGRIERAAELSRKSTSAFVVDAAMDAADKVLARADVTIMSAEQFDSLMSALDVADEAPGLAKLNSVHRGYVRK